MLNYGQFCPVARAVEVFGERCTPLVVRELMCGSTHFNDIRRGVPRMATTLLVQRLRKLAGCAQYLEVARREQLRADAARGGGAGATSSPSVAQRPRPQP
jgi:hypothetical protein